MRIGGPRRHGADRSSCFMPYGNSDEQLLCLPGNGVAFTGPQLTVSIVLVESQVHGVPGAEVVVQTANVGWLSCVLNLISFASCPPPHCRLTSGPVQSASLGAGVRKNVVITRPFFD
jgi:hypothetical protein